MPIYKSKKPTKDGRAWFFKVQYKDNFEQLKVFVSKMYSTKTEAKDGERQFFNDLNKQNKAPKDMTLGDLWDKFIEYQDDKVKISTKRGYLYKKQYLEPLFNIKCVDYSPDRYEAWKKYMKDIDSMKTVSKNDVYKVLVAFLHWGMKHYNYNWGQTISLMTRFDNPNELKTERQIYSLEQFQQFLTGEDELRYRCLWETLYYCGLRIGEARGLQWKNVDWKKKTISIEKQVLDIDNYSATYYFSSLKTQTSRRKLPMCDALYNDLKEYYDQVSIFKNFNPDFFVFGEDYGTRALTYQCARRRKGRIAKLSGVKEIRIHDFRHSCASLLINKGLPVTIVSKYMGHASINETMHTYAHMFDGALGDVTNLLNNISADSNDEEEILPN